MKNKNLELATEKFQVGAFGAVGSITLCIRVYYNSQEYRLCDQKGNYTEYNREKE